MKQSTRNVVFGAIGVFWGGGIVQAWLRGYRPEPVNSNETAYAVGNFIGISMGFLFLIAGGYYLASGIHSLKAEKQKPKKSKKKRPLTTPTNLED